VTKIKEEPAMSKAVAFGDRLVGEGHPAFIIAEASINHNREVSLAKEMVSAAKEIGCDCIKFQAFTADTLYADKEATITYQSQGEAITESEHALFTRLAFNPDEWAEITAECKKQDIFFLATIQDLVDLKMMMPLGLQAIKVGSDDFDHPVNLKIYAETGLPLIVSKGMADMAEVDRVITSLMPLTDKLLAMHCVSLYPSDPQYLNLRQIPHLASLYPDVIWGFSDHSQGTIASTMAVGLGARMIEKHFTLDHDLPGPDHWFSMDVDEMGQLVRDIRFCEAAMGDGQISPSAEELKSKQVMRRRLVAKTDLEPGAVLDEDTVTFKRSTYGSFIGNWEQIKGHRLANPRKADQGIDLADVDLG